jgi:hypothetical protein
MPMPYYVSPEQMMQDKAEYAKKGIAKGRSIIAIEYVNGILLVAENPSASLYKIRDLRQHRLAGPVRLRLKSEGQYWHATSKDSCTAGRCDSAFCERLLSLGTISH